MAVEMPCPPLARTAKFLITSFYRRPITKADMQTAPAPSSRTKVASRQRNALL